MAQFDVFRNPNRSARSVFPFVIVLQHDLSFAGRTVIVAPVARAESGVNDRLAIPVEIEGQPHLVMVGGLAAIPETRLRDKVGAAEGVRDQLPRAIDVLFLGF